MYLFVCLFFFLKTGVINILGIEGYKINVRRRRNKLSRNDSKQKQKRGKPVEIEEPSHWLENLPSMPEPRVGAGTALIGMPYDKNYIRIQKKPPHVIVHVFTQSTLTIRKYNCRTRQAQ